MSIIPSDLGCSRAPARALALCAATFLAAAFLLRGQTDIRRDAVVNAADAAGLRKNFVINGIEGSPVAGYYHAFMLLEQAHTGDGVEISAWVPRTHGDLIFGYRQAEAQPKIR